jgi:predicted XRE-type DNA-binding protein
MEIYKNLSVKSLENEIWKNIEEYQEYSVSNFGRAKSLKFKKERMLKQQKRGDYFCIDLCKNGKYKSKQIHTLVFEAHNNYKLKDNECVHHINENKENNFFDNLQLKEKSDHNSFHSKGKNNPMFGKHHSEKTKETMSEKHIGKHHSEETKLKISEKQKGESSPNHKLTEEQVIQIKLLLKEGILTQQEIADIFGVSQMTISRIKNEKRWKYIKL